MPFMLPTAYGPANASPFIITGESSSEAFLVGVDYKSLPLGSRMGVDVSMPPLEYDDDARLWIAALGRAERGEEVLMEWLQPGLTIGAPGDLRVGGPSSANATAITVRKAAGGASTYGALAGQFFNVIDAEGRRYLHAVAMDAATPLSMFPRLRLPVVDGMVLDFATPMIQGFIVPNGGKYGWNVDNARKYGIQFTIKERK